ncbi:nucleoside triphosphate pyrophosphatase [Paenibacillus sp. UNC499MF]|uniref:Maf family protein n=1 Tax=Paenibacillus sp. UNC499MF TaxID=1502751 RepID=UPI0008A04C17|nr:Maf family protein [Paenibacillus sp. UNC499MF]SEG33768.1 septum formation protein [Paenibacillus sp. UNC499MF]
MSRSGSAPYEQGIKLILASSSPRRRELLKGMGLDFEIISSDADETVEESLSPREIVETLAVRKAEAVADALPGSYAPDRTVIIGSDTIVVLDGEVLGKPKDERDALRMLFALQGRTHEVYSGVACMSADRGNVSVRHRRTKVAMKQMDEERILRYIATGEPSDKAGSYAIQGIGATLIEGIEGDYFNVVGLPVSLLSEMLEPFGIRVI